METVPCSVLLPETRERLFTNSLSSFPRNTVCPPLTSPTPPSYFPLTDSTLLLAIDLIGRGGQSALRFSRLREEKRHNYVRKVAELAVQHFITNDKVNVAGIVLAGSADFKTELGQSDLFDGRLVAKVLKVVDVSYGGENGFNQVSLLSMICDCRCADEMWILGNRTGS